MPPKKQSKDPWTNFSSDDIDEWAGVKIADRGRNYQRRGRVSELARMSDGRLIAWVEGTQRYATCVDLEEDDVPDSICTCPYEVDCKHAVALVLEYQKQLRSKEPISEAEPDDVRLALLDEDVDEETFVMTEAMRQDIDRVLKGKTKSKLIEVIHDLAAKYPQVARALSDRQQLVSGDIEKLVARLRAEIHHIGDAPGWQNYWNNEGFTPDYTEVRHRMTALLEAGHADVVLSLGHELVITGTRLVEMSDDHGETAEEVAGCMPLIAAALAQSTLDAAGKLNWALNAELEDQYDICEPLAAYLHQRHPRAAWKTLADRLLARLKDFKGTKGADAFSRNYERNRLSDWTIHALERAGRKAEIIPLCEVEARRTGSFGRLVDRLIQDRCYEDAERWIKEGIKSVGNEWAGTASGLRQRLLEIRRLEKNWPAVAAIQVEEFVRRPSLKGYTECRQSSQKIKAWPKVRQSLLDYLEKGHRPWSKEDWPLPETGLDKPELEPRKHYPMRGDLIDIAILEKKPAKVLKWYDLRPKEHYRGSGINDDAVANAVQTHAPERAVAIWKEIAEGLIALVKPSAYQKAAKYLRKGAKVMRREKKSAEWGRYLKTLRQQHYRKRRLMEILDALE